MTRPFDNGFAQRSRIDFVDIQVTFAGQSRACSFELLKLFLEYRGRNRAIDAREIVGEVAISPEVEDDRDNRNLDRSRHPQERSARSVLQACGINHGQTTATQSFTRNVPQDRERLSRHGLVRFIISDQSAATIRRDYLRWTEVTGSKGRLPCPGRAYQ